MSKPVIILTIPEVSTDEALELALGAPFEDGYYLSFMLAPRDGNLRAIFRRQANYKEPADRAAEAAEEEKAVALVKAHPNLTQNATVGMLAAKGITRTQGWVGVQRARMAFTPPKRHES